MSSRTFILLFGVLICVAFVAAFNEEELEDGEVSEVSVVDRVVRDASPKKRGKKGKSAGVEAINAQEAL